MELSICGNEKDNKGNRMTDMKTHVPSLLEDYVLLCEFPTHIVEMHAQDTDRLKTLIDCNIKNPMYHAVKLYEIRNKHNETVYRREV